MKIELNLMDIEPDLLIDHLETQIEMAYDLGLDEFMTEFLMFNRLLDQLIPQVEYHSGASAVFVAARNYWKEIKRND
ncbi:hypothetical protein D3C72_2013010 [compost metagenome]